MKMQWNSIQTGSPLRAMNWFSLFISLDTGFCYLRDLSILFNSRHPKQTASKKYILSSFWTWCCSVSFSVKVCNLSVVLLNSYASKQFILFISVQAQGNRSMICRWKRRATRRQTFTSWKDYSAFILIFKVLRHRIFFDFVQFRLNKTDWAIRSFNWQTNRSVVSVISIFCHLRNLRCKVLKFFSFLI